MDLPSNLGTPGAANSRFVAHAPSAITEVMHQPILPAAGEAAVVTAAIRDFAGLGTAVLKYRPDPATTYTSVRMRDDGGRWGRSCWRWHFQRHNSRPAGRDLGGILP